MQNKLRRSEARLLSGAYRKVSASNAVFCAIICADSLIGKTIVKKGLNFMVIKSKVY